MTLGQKALGFIQLKVRPFQRSGFRWVNLHPYHKVCAEGLVCADAEGACMTPQRIYELYAVSAAVAAKSKFSNNHRGKAVQVDIRLTLG